MEDSDHVPLPRSAKAGKLKKASATAASASAHGHDRAEPGGKPARLVQKRLAVQLLKKKKLLQKKHKTQPLLTLKARAKAAAASKPSSGGNNTASDEEAPSDAGDGDNVAGDSDHDQAEVLEDVQSKVSAEAETAADDSGDRGAESEEAMANNARKVKGMTAEELAEYNRQQKRRGVIYLSRVPPFMRPHKLRHLLSQYGEVDRIYLKPETDAARRQRILRGGNKKLKYSEGWVEFLDKKLARRVAESLNGTNVGGKKTSFYYDELWTMKYLPKFKWHHLTERVVYDKAVRQHRLQAEMQQVQRESNFYVEQAMRAKKLKRSVEEGKVDLSAPPAKVSPALVQRQALI